MFGFSQEEEELKYKENRGKGGMRKVAIVFFFAFFFGIFHVAALLTRQLSSGPTQRAWWQGRFAQKVQRRDIQ